VFRADVDGRGGQQQHEKDDILIERFKQVAEAHREGGEALFPYVYTDCCFFVGHPFVDHLG
jgi:hypothetical protein